MKILKFKCDGRQAALLSDKYLADAKAAFSFSVPSARYTPAHKLWLQQKALGIPEEDRQGWDGKKSMMKDGQISVGLLLGAKDDLAKAGFIADIVEWKNKPKVIIGSYTRHTEGFEEKDLRYVHQNYAVTNMLNSISDFGGGLLLSATGTGKTKTAAQFFSWLECKCLFVVNRTQLLYQAQKEIQEWLSKEGYDTKVGIVGNSKFNLQRITVATIQTLHKRAKKKEVRDWLRSIDIILIDELHKQMNKSNFNVIDIAKPQAVIGLTATMQLKRKPIRFRCYSICGPQIFQFSMTEGVEAGVLSQGIVVQVPVAPNPDGFKKPVAKISDAVKREKEYVHEAVLNSNVKHLIKGLVNLAMVEDLCVVVLVDRIVHLKSLQKMLIKHDPQMFYGAVKVKDRKKQLKMFDKGKENLIIANRVFTEGINLKRIDLVIDGAQRSSRDDAQQKFGRAARLHAEKAGIWYIDIFTEVAKLEKAAKERKGAFKQIKVPIKVLTSDFTKTAPWSAKEIFEECNILLTEVLKKNKDKSAQGKLF